MQAKRKILAAAMMIGVAGALAGCTGEGYYETGYYEPAPSAYVVTPGYYYVPEYYDYYHVHHPREYYYYDGHRYYHHRVPHGYVAREMPHEHAEHYYHR